MEEERKMETTERNVKIKRNTSSVPNVISHPHRQLLSHKTPFYRGHIFPRIRSNQK